MEEAVTERSREEKMTSEITKSRTAICRYLFFAAVFISCLIFYIHVSPMVIYNMDDWYFTYYTRKPWPVWGGWNPTRVLPELLMPFTARLSVWMINPIMGNFVRSVELGMSIMLSLIVTAYAFFFFQMTGKKTTEHRAMLLTVLFLVLHLLVFRTKSKQNDNLLSGYYDATTFFFYLIPAVWNGSLVMYFISADYFKNRKDQSPGIRAAVLLAAYLGIFSNIFQSGILAIYTALDLLSRLMKGKDKERFHLKDAGFHLLILIGCAVSLVFEFFGKRSRQIGTRNLPALKNQMIDAGKRLLVRLEDMNPLFVFLFLIALICLICRFLTKKKNSGMETVEKESLMLLAGAFLLLIYEWVLCGASETGYVTRGDVLVCPFFCMFLFILSQIGWMCSKVRLAQIAILLTVFICFFSLFTKGRTWKNRTNGGIEPSVARQVTQDIVDAVLEASASRKESVEVQVPDFGGDNWPIALYGGSHVSQALYNHGIIAKPIKVAFVPAKELNEKYGLP